MTLRVAAGVWAVLVLAVAGRVAVAPARSHTVVPIYSNAAGQFERTESLYEPVPGLDVYRNPPGFAAAFMPFAWLPEKVAGVVWRFLGAGLFLYGLIRLGRDVVGLDDRGLAWLLLLPLPLALASLDNGQANLHLAGLVSLGFAAAGRERLTGAGAWLAVAAGIKLYPLAVGLLAGVARPRLVSRLVIWTVLAVTFPFALTNGGYVADQFREMTASATADDRLHSASLDRAPRDWTIVARTWAGWIPDERLVRGVSAVAGLVFAGIVFHTRRLLTAFVLGSVWMTLFGPATEPPTYVLLAPALAATLLTASGWAKGLAVAAWWLFVVQVIRDAFPGSWRLGVLGPQPIGAAVLMIAGLMELSGVGRRGPSRMTRWLDRLVPTGHMTT